jgi:hypothetical protein
LLLPALNTLKNKFLLNNVRTELNIPTDGQLEVSLSRCQAPIWDKRPNILLSSIIFWTVTGFLMWGALSDERSRL